MSFNRSFSFLAFALFFILLSGCRKLVEVEPPSNSVTESSVFTNDLTAIAVLTGIYTEMSRVGEGIGFSGSSSISVLSGLSSDELTLHSGVTSIKFVQYYKNELGTELTVGAGYEAWIPFYNYIYKCNAAIEGLTNDKANSLNPIVRRQLQGEILFLRAFFYFYLVNMFGDVPLAITTDYQVNTLLTRAPVQQVYYQIITDLKAAEELLSENYLGISLLSSTTERVRPTKWAAAALLSRASLFIGNYAQAKIQATKLIENSTLFGLPPLNSVFLKNSMEAVWQLQPVTPSFNTQDGRTFIIPPTGPSNSVETNPVYLSREQLTAFEPNDNRAIYGNWIDSTVYLKNASEFDTVYFAYKYKVRESVGVTAAGGLTEYLTVLRVAEQYLIRAEALAHLGDISGAQSDLNIIRQRAGLPPTTAGDKNSLLAAILHERQTELFCEFGHRWFDLKRTGNVDAVMSVVTPLKGGTWQTTDQLYPISNTEILRAPNLVQNPGY